MWVLILGWETWVTREGKNLKEILKNGIQRGNQFEVGTKNVVIGALKHVFSELSVKYVDLNVCIHKI